MFVIGEKLLYYTKISRCICISSAFLFKGFCSHCIETNENSPYVSAGFRNHKHTNHRDGICPENNRNIKSEAQDDGQPHILKFCVTVILCTFVKKNNNQKTEKRKRNVSVNSPGKRSFSAQPVILRKRHRITRRADNR